MITMTADLNQHGAWYQVVTLYETSSTLFSVGVLAGCVLLLALMVWVRSGEPNWYDLE